MAQSFRETRVELNARISARLRSAWTASKLLRGCFVAGGAALAGAAQFWTWPDGGNPSSAQIVGIGATVAVFLAAFISILTDKDASEELRLAHIAAAYAEDAQDKAEEISRLFPDIERMIALYNSTLLMRGALEHATVAMVGDETHLVATLLKLADKQIAIAAGFNLSDQYTICVFQAAMGADGCRYELQLVAHYRAIECAVTTARTWPEGQGVAGVAFSNSMEIIVGDLTQDSARAVFSAPGMQRSYDDDRYRSIVAVPVLVEGNAKPWGVVVATNDREGHFNHDQKPGLKPEEAIRALANYAALAVAMVQSRERGKSPSPTVP